MTDPSLDPAIGEFLRRAAGADRRDLPPEGFWIKLRRVAGKVPFAEDLAAAYYCARDRKTPTRVRGVLMAAAAYFVMPVDMIPDIVTGLGFTDDAAVLTAVLTIVGGYVNETHREKARRALFLEQDSGPL